MPCFPPTGLRPYRTAGDVAADIMQSQQEEAISREGFAAVVATFPTPLAKWQGPSFTEEEWRRMNTATQRQYNDAFAAEVPQIAYPVDELARLWHAAHVEGAKIAPPVHAVYGTMSAHKIVQKAFANIEPGSMSSGDWESFQRDFNKPTRIVNEPPRLSAEQVREMEALLADLMRRRKLLDA